MADGILQYGFNYKIIVYCVINCLNDYRINCYSFVCRILNKYLNKFKLENHYSINVQFYYLSILVCCVDALCLHECVCVQCMTECGQQVIIKIRISLLINFAVTDWKLFRILSTAEQ